MEKECCYKGGITPYFHLIISGPKLQGQSDFGSMDMVGVSDVGDHLTMDSEDLVPSLQVSVLLFILL